MQINLIITRLFAFYKVKTYAALAKKLGVSATTLANWKSRNTIDYDILFTKCEGVNWNWLFIGKGPMMINDLSESQLIDEESPPGNSKILERIIKSHELTIKTQGRYILNLEEQIKDLKMNIDNLKPDDEDGQKKKGRIIKLTQRIPRARSEKSGNTKTIIVRLNKFGSHRTHVLLPQIICYISYFTYYQTLILLCA